jgi:PhnB protein
MANVTITPYLLYEDLGAALEWLARAFGFREILRHAGRDGRPVHAEMELGDGGRLLTGHPGPQYRNPKHIGHRTHNLYVRVEDVDKLFERAVQAGAEVVEKPADQDYGERRCGVDDLEGHRWYFAHPLARRG